MTSFTLCTLISLNYTTLLARRLSYVPLLPPIIFSKVSLQKQKNNITTGTSVLARRQKGHIVAAGGFIAMAGRYLVKADSSSALKALCSSQAL